MLRRAILGIGLVPGCGFPGAGCFLIFSGRGLWQGDLTAGLVFAF